jgi:hypothetical protein
VYIRRRGTIKSNNNSTSSIYATRHEPVMNLVLAISVACLGVIAMIVGIKALLK